MFVLDYDMTNRLVDLMGGFVLSLLPMCSVSKKYYTNVKLCNLLPAL